MAEFGPLRVCELSIDGRQQPADGFFNTLGRYTNYGTDEAMA
jgi:hypothetical protein